MTKDFQEMYPQVDFDITVYNSESYAFELNQAAQEGRLPDVFDSTELDVKYLEQLEQLDVTYSMLKDKSKYLFLDSYEILFKEKKQIPLCIQVPVIYKRLNMESGNWSVRPEDAMIYERQFHMISREEYEVVLKKNNRRPEEALQMFIEGEAETYYSDTGDYQLLAQKIPAQFSLEFPKVEEPFVRFDHLWSINGASGHEEKKSAQWLLSFLLTDGAQNELGIHAMEGVPVSREMQRVFFDVYQSDLSGAGKWIGDAEAGDSDWLADNVSYQAEWIKGKK